jgi:peptide/nickel transport system substrate-binding protein
MGLSDSRKPRRPRLGLYIALIAVLGCGFIAIFIAASTTLLAEEEEEPVDNSITYGLTLSPSGIDPHINRSAELGIPLYSVYDTLVYRHPQTFEFVSGLAESWDISEDGRTYTFQLKQGVTFHDGTPFDANAVGVTLDRIVDDSDEQTLSQKSLFMLGPYYEGYVIADDYTIQIQLTDPYAPLLDALSQPYFGIASPTALANYSRETYQLHQVGTGPYELTNYIPGDRIVLEKNEDYAWGPVFYAELDERQEIERITFRFFQDPESRRIALEAGDVDVIGELPPNDAELLLANREFRIFEQPIPGQPLQFYFNTQVFPTDDPLVRQAIILATNRQAIVDTIFRTEFSPIAYGPVSASMPYYDPSLQELYAYDPGRAAELFRTAGFVDTDEDGILDREGIPLQISIIVPPWGFNPEVAALLESQWTDIGIDLEIIQVPGINQLEVEAEKGEHNLVSLNDFGTDPSLLNQYYLSSGTLNYTGYADEDLDAWLLQALDPRDEVERAELYRLVQNRIMDEALILPIRDYVNLVGWTETLDGLIFAPQGWWPLLTNLQFEE